MAFTGVTVFPFEMTPLTNTAPFTYRDGTTYLEVLAKIQKWLNEVLVPDTNAAVANAIAEFQAGIANAEARIVESEEKYEALMASTLASVDSSIGGMTNYVNTEVAGAKTYVDNAIQFINNKTGQAQIQRTTLAAPFTVEIDPLWPNNHPIQLVLTQDATGNRPVTIGPNITGTLDVNPNPNGVTEFTLEPIGGGQWRIAQKAPESFLIVENYRKPGDVSDKDKFQRAVNAAKTLNIKQLRANASEYLFHERVDLGAVDNMTISGAGNQKTVIKAAPGAGHINMFSLSAGFKNVIIEGFDFVGGVIENPTVPTRARTYAADRMASALWFNGDLGMTQITTDVVENLTFRNNRVYGSAGLPLWLSGLRGKTVVENNIFDNNYDIGFMYVENLWFEKNRILNSRDNGVSVSRGTKNAFIRNNYIKNAAYWGVWAGGFLATGNTQADRENPANWGPSNVVISDNIVETSGYGGVYAAVGPKVLQIHDNIFKDGLSGPVDAPNDQYGVGVYIGGLSNGVGGYATWAENISIHDNKILRMSRGGVYIGAASKRVFIHHNEFEDLGWQFLANGTTEVLNTEVDRNYGVYVHLTTDDVYIEENKFFDYRATPYFNKPISTHGGTNYRARNNIARGNRIVMEETVPARLATKVLGLTNATSDLIDRAQLLYDGANLSLNMYDATGALTSTPIKVRVSDGVMTLGNTTVLAAGLGLRLPTTTTAGRPTGQSVGTTFWDTDLAKQITFAGANWRDAMGNVV